MHLYALGEKGFIIMAASDVARPVLAYSLDGAFDPAQLSPSLKGLLDTYEAEITMAEKAGAPVDPAWEEMLAGNSLLAGAKGATTAVEPLITTKWGQGQPYNNMCPSGVPSGCVSTSTSQVMRFWSYPAFGQGSHTYNSATFGNLGADFAHTRYDWQHMPDVAGSSSVEHEAVAVLTYHVGVSVNMNYNYSQSGATTGAGDNCALEALRNYFHYNKTDLSYHSKNTTTDSAWVDFLMAELTLGRPILYDGVSGSLGGHSFICDGFDSLRMMHFNLGEFGEGDGYYAIGAITYMQLNLNSNNAAIIGIHPEYGIYASDSVLVYHRSGGEQKVWVAASDTCTKAWVATASESWITLSDTAFEKLGEMTVSLSANTSGTERYGTITLQQGVLSTTIAIKQTAFDPEDFCPLTVYMESSRNQAWSNEAHLSFESPSGLIYATAAHLANGSNSVQTVSVAPYDVVVRWIAGGPLDRYYNYTIMNGNGDTLVSVRNAYYNGKDTLIEHPCSNAGIGDLRADSTVNLALYPNPAISLVEVEANVPIRQIVARDIMGVVFYSSTARRIDTSEWPAGVYLITIVTDYGSTTKRLLKQ